MRCWCPAPSGRRARPATAPRAGSPRLCGAVAEQKPFSPTVFLHPQPRLPLAQALRDHAAAAMDVSDGLVGDFAKMMSASGCGGLVRAAQVPLSDAAAAAIAAEPALLADVLGGGDDYEIATAVPARRRAGVPCRCPGGGYRGRRDRRDLQGRWTRSSGSRRPAALSRPAQLQPLLSRRRLVQRPSNVLVLSHKVPTMACG